MFLETLFGRERVRLEEVAWDVRRQFETREAYTERLMRLYAAMVVDPGGLEGFFRIAKESFPRSNCGIATVALLDRLGRGEISKDATYGGRTHTVLLIGKGTIVDITADQFGGPKVYAGQVKDPWHVRTW